MYPPEKPAQARCPAPVKEAEPINLQQPPQDLSIMDGRCSYQACTMSLSCYFVAMLLQQHIDNL